MDRLFDLFKYDKKYDYERELNASSRTIERCDIVIRQIVRDDYDRMCNKRFDIASSYIVEFEAELVDQVRSAANGGWSFVKVDESLTENQKREFYNWCKDYIPIVKDAIHREVLLLLKDIAYYPDEQSADCLYYNFWGDNFKLFCESSINALGATDEQRASFDVDYNIQFFTLKYEGLKTSMDQSYMIAGMLQTPDYSSCIQKSKSLFQDTFNDYIRRILEHGNNIDIVENSGLGWMFFTKRFCEESDSKGIITSTFTSNVVMPILSEMQTNFLKDIERKRTVLEKRNEEKDNADTADIFKKLEEKRDDAIRRKLDETKVLNRTMASGGLKRGRIYFNLWGSDYYKYAAPLFKMKPLPEDKKPLIDRVSNSDYFSKKIASKLALYKCDSDYYEDKNVCECSEHILLLLNDYMDFVASDRGMIANEFVNEAIDWCDASQYAIHKAVSIVLSSVGPVSPIQCREYKKVELFLYGKVSGCMAEMIVNHAKFYNWNFKFVMPYNMVGDDFSKRAQEASTKFVLSPAEKRCVSYVHNISMFMSFFSQELLTIKEMVESGKEYNEEIRDYSEWLKTIAEDYLMRLSESNPPDPTAFVAQTQLWVWQTKNLFKIIIDEGIVVATYGTKANANKKQSWDVENAKMITVLEEVRQMLDNTMEEIESGLSSFSYDSLCEKIAEIRDGKMKKTLENNIDTQKQIYYNSEGISFSTHLTPVQHEQLKQKLGEELHTKPGYKGLVYIRAAVLENYITDPSYPELMKTYPTIKTKEQNFSGFLGATGKFVIEISHKNQELLNNAREQLKILIDKGSEEQ